MTTCLLVVAILPGCGGRVRYLEEEIDEGIDCSGTFSKPELLFDEGDHYPQALAPSADGLELFYVRLALDENLDPVGPRTGGRSSHFGSTPRQRSICRRSNSPGVCRLLSRGF